MVEGDAGRFYSRSASHCPAANESSLLAFGGCEKFLHTAIKRSDIGGLLRSSERSGAGVSQLLLDELELIQSHPGERVPIGTRLQDCWVGL